MAKCQNAVALSIKLAVIDAIEAGVQRKFVAKSSNLPKSFIYSLSTVLKLEMKLALT